MKKKLIIVVTLVVLLALGGTLAFAAVDEDGNIVNPFSRLLEGKVEDGTITQDDADTFTRVWDAIKGDMEENAMTRRAGGRTKGDMTEGRPGFNSEFMEEYRSVMQAKTEEVMSGLVESGVLDAEALEGEKPAIMSRDMDEETLAAVKDAMATVREYMDDYLDSKVADGTITQERADMFGMKGSGRMGMDKGSRMPSGKTQRGTTENPGDDS